MSNLLVLILTSLQLSTLQANNHTFYKDDVLYYELPRFWSNVGFCPAGAINHDELMHNLLANEVQMNLRLIGALPTGSVRYVRIHWLLELIEFVAYTQAGVPIFDFTHLDTFLENLREYGLLPSFEFMCNPGNIFLQNPNRNALLWENFAFQVLHHFLATYGAKEVANWRFETWNEPDLLAYNKLNFSSVDYVEYALAVRRGMTLATRRVSTNLQISLHGPAGLFRNESHHPICWRILQFCHEDIEQCPFSTFTYHRKGHGHARELLEASDELLKIIHTRFYNLNDMPVANNEADPIVNWSRPEEFHADMRYAWILVNIVLGHWSAKLTNRHFEHLSYISHDNAFLSYHPHEFTQRTLLAHFRMNNSEPVHSQFIKKPVYGALALLSRLGAYASDVELLPGSQMTVQLLKTTAGDNVPQQLSWFLVPTENSSMTRHNFTFKRSIAVKSSNSEEFAFGLDFMAQELTDPYFIWQANGNPSFPSAALREQMRLAQMPRLNQYGKVHNGKLDIIIQNISGPWLLLIRVCSNLAAKAKPPQSLLVTRVTSGEVFINWQEDVATTICLKTYEVWFKGTKNSSQNWQLISESWHLPFPSFQYAPETHLVSGFYKIRSQNLFDNLSEFSQIVEYYEI